MKPKLNVTGRFINLVYRTEKIFDEVKKTGTAVVAKNETAECELLAPEETVRMMDELNDAGLFALTTERVVGAGAADAIPQENDYRELNLLWEGLVAPGELELEYEMFERNIAETVYRYKK